jgi:hypothetical protein
MRACRTCALLIALLLASCSSPGGSSTPMTTAEQSPAGASQPAAPSGTSTPTATPGTSQSLVASPSPGADAVLLTVNAGGGGLGSLPPAWSFQVQYPARYLVTDDWMITSFQSQGGLAPPRLVFTTGSQLMGLRVTVDDLITARDQDCIMIWSTGGFASVGDWENSSLVPVIGALAVVSERSEKLGAFTFVIREVAPQGGAHLLEAFVQLPNDLSYFFNTCTVDTRTDLLTILQTFQVRREAS